MKEHRIFGNSVLAQLIRSTDWSTTPLGNIASWSDTLLVSVNLLLSAPIPMQLLWGPDFICIYNDAMAPALSNKHPQSLGQPAKEVWQEAWEQIGTQMEQVFSSGESVSFTNAPVPLLIDGTLEDRYWTYSYSPVFDPSVPSWASSMCPGHHRGCRDPPGARSC